MMGQGDTEKGIDIFDAARYDDHDDALHYDIL